MLYVEIEQNLGWALNLTSMDGLVVVSWTMISHYLILSWNEYIRAFVSLPLPLYVCVCVCARAHVCTRENQLLVVTLRGSQQNTDHVPTTYPRPHCSCQMTNDPFYQAVTGFLPTGPSFPGPSTLPDKDCWDNRWTSLVPGQQPTPKVISSLIPTLTHSARGQTFQCPLPMSPVLPVCAFLCFRWANQTSVVCLWANSWKSFIRESQHPLGRCTEARWRS